MRDYMTCNIIDRLLTDVGEKLGYSPELDHYDGLAQKLNVSNSTLKKAYEYPAFRRDLSDATLKSMACFVGFDSFESYIRHILPSLQIPNELTEINNGMFFKINGQWFSNEEASQLTNHKSDINQPSPSDQSFLFPDGVFDNPDGDDYFDKIKADINDTDTFKKFVEYVLELSGVITQDNFNAIIHLFTGYKFPIKTRKVLWDCKNDYRDRILIYIVRHLIPSATSKRYDILRENVEWLNIDKTEMDKINSIKISQLAERRVPDRIKNKLSSFYPSFFGVIKS